MLYTAAFTGTPNGALLSQAAVLTQSLIMANLQRVDAGYTYLNCGPDVPHRHAHDDVGHLRVRRGQRVHAPRRRRGAVPGHRRPSAAPAPSSCRPTIDQILEVNADGRYDLSSLRTFGGKPEWNAMITVDDSPWATTPGRLRPDRGHRHAHLQRAGRRRGRATRAGRRPWWRCACSTPTATRCATGETGEIAARGPQVMNGYRNHDDETARRQAGGWHHTNDLGRREADGSLSFVGPKGRLVKSAAENIYPAEVEGCAERPSGGERVGHHRRPRPHVGPVGAGRGGAGRRPDRHRGRDHRARAGAASPRTRSPSRSCSATSPSPATAGPSTTTPSTPSTAAAATPAAADPLARGSGRCRLVRVRHARLVA